MKKKNDIKNQKGQMIMIISVATLFILLFVFGLLIKLRPEYSVSEKRKLASFPEFSIEGVWTGSYFKDIGEWYQDTYPGREKFLSMQPMIEDAYGIKSEAIYGDADRSADEIPDEVKSLAPVMDIASDETKEEEEPALEETKAVENQENQDIQDNQDIQEDTEDEKDIVGEKAGNIYLCDDAGYEIYYFNKPGAEHYASMINTVKSILPDKNIYLMIVPNSFGIMIGEKQTKDLGASNMKDALNYVYSMVDDSVNKVKIYDVLKKHKDEYIYFRTDHHWTALGAYYAYREFASIKGVVPHELSDYRNLSFEDFLGSFYFGTKQAKSLKEHPDTIKAYVPIGTNEEVFTDKKDEAVKWHVITDVEKSPPGLKYNTFIGGDNSFTEIHNPSSDVNGSCVIIKESYGNAYVPFMVDHYKDIYVIDYRYFKGNLLQFIKDKNIDDVIFVNNVMAITENRASKIMKMFK